jgi:hypothetical protein
LQEFSADVMVEGLSLNNAHLLDKSLSEDDRYNPEFQILNNKDADVMYETSKQLDNDAVWKVRWRGTFKEEFELWDFPFDVQDFTIKVAAVCHRNTVLVPMIEQRPDNPSIFQHQNFGMKVNKHS